MIKIAVHRTQMAGPRQVLGVTLCMSLGDQRIWGEKGLKDRQNCQSADVYGSPDHPVHDCGQRIRITSGLTIS